MNEQQMSEQWKSYKQMMNDWRVSDKEMNEQTNKWTNSNENRVKYETQSASHSEYYLSYPVLCVHDLILLKHGVVFMKRGNHQ